MGTAAVAAPAAAVASAGALAAGAAPAAPALVAAAETVAVAAAAAGPVGWIVAGTIGIAIVAGEERTDARCWEQVLGSTHLDEIEDSKREFHGKHGMLLSEVASCCTVLKSEDDERLILRNRHGDHFAFSISLVVPAGTYNDGPNAEHDVIVAHAVPVESLTYSGGGDETLSV